MTHGLGKRRAVPSDSGQQGGLAEVPRGRAARSQLIGPVRLGLALAEALGQVTLKKLLRNLGKSSEVRAGGWAGEEFRSEADGLDWGAAGIAQTFLRRSSVWQRT